MKRVKSQRHKRKARFLHANAGEEGGGRERGSEGGEREG